MATLKTRTLFFVTSPRSPFKMIPEIKLLCENFYNQEWNIENQEKFARLLSDREFFQGEANNDSSFSARDRINRSPKALGFVDLKPNIKLTIPGEQLIYGKRPHEILCRQMLKFQLPSPFHRDSNSIFNVKPYLEMLRLIYDLEYLTKDEIKIFGLQLTDYNKFDFIKKKIVDFRKKVKGLDRSKTSYNRFANDTLINETFEIYKYEIENGLVKTRESRDTSIEKFISTKMRNVSDYADACFRYLRATELVTTGRGNSYLKMSPLKRDETEFILSSVERKPLIFNNEESYKEYLFDSTLPKLMTDEIEMNKQLLIKLGLEKQQIDSLDIEALKDLRDELIMKRRQESISIESNELKTYSQFQDIEKVFHSLMGGRLPYDAPLLLEWNAWRAFCMLNDGQINGNFKTDDEGMPLMTASGNMADVECIYEDFNTIIEVTLSTGQKQFEMEGEPIARHLANYKKKFNNKDTYCLFIANKINPATLAYIFMLHKTPISYYGGKSKIIPIDIGTLVHMLHSAYNSKNKPNSSFLKAFLINASNAADYCSNEADWFEKIRKYAEKWAG